MNPRRIGRHVSGGPEEREDPGSRLGESLRESLAGWPAGVTLVAVRAGERVHALTVTAFIPVSLQPPLVLVSLGPNASAAPYLDPDVEFGISLLSAAQKGIASRFADSFPVGPSPFPPSGPPIVEGALAGLVCDVDEVLVRADHSLVLGRVRDVRAGPDAPALAWRYRDYRIVD